MDVQMTRGRRDFLRLSTAGGAGLIIGACRNASTSNSKGQPPSSERDEKKAEETGGEVTATEDLMREHGVLRRALIVYSEAAAKLRVSAASVSPDALQKTAKLFRAFGEEYHEQKLEDAYIFPAVKKAGGPASALADILIAQHQRGREITNYILSA